MWNTKYYRNKKRVYEIANQGYRLIAKHWYEFTHVNSYQLWRTRTKIWGQLVPTLANSYQNLRSTRTNFGELVPKFEVNSYLTWLTPTHVQLANSYPNFWRTRTQQLVGLPILANSYPGVQLASSYPNFWLNSYTNYYTNNNTIWITIMFYIITFIIIYSILAKTCD